MEIGIKRDGLLGKEEVHAGVSTVIGRSAHGEPLFIFLENNGSCFLSVKGDDKFEAIVSEYSLNENNDNRTVPD